jgi:hypothetical protein
VDDSLRDLLGFIFKEREKEEEQEKGYGEGNKKRIRVQRALKGLVSLLHSNGVKVLERKAAKLQRGERKRAVDC